VLGLLLLGSLALNGVLALAALAGMAPQASPLGGLPGYEEILVDGDKGAKDKIVVLAIEGVILDDKAQGLGMVGELRQLLRRLRKADDLKAVILEINSPGGGITASDQIYHALVEFRRDKKVPLVSLFDDVAASGGYYVAMASDHIVAHPTTITGSIGVISQFLVWKDLMEKVGIEVEVIKSLNAQGKSSYKDIGSPFRRMTPEERQLLQNLITEMWERFVAVVSEGRKGRLTPEQVRELADGRIFSGAQALRLKLVDEIGYQENAFRKARELAQAPEARVVRLKRKPPGLLELLYGVEGRSPLPRPMESLAEGPRLLYLWPGY
jgi:protease-4